MELNHKGTLKFMVIEEELLYLDMDKYYPENNIAYLKGGKEVKVPHCDTKTKAINYIINNNLWK